VGGLPLKTAVILLSILSLTAVGVYVLRIWADESLYTHRGSLAYWMCISKTIRNVPEVGHVTDVVFYSSAGDGPKRSANAVSYSTDASHEMIVGELTRYFQGLGGSVGFSFEDSGVTTGNHASPIRASITLTSQGKLEVTVTETD
jgi:hypothetical protein